MFALKIGGWKTIFSFWEFPYFQVRTVSLRKVVIFVELRSKSSTRSIRDIPSSWQSFRFFSLEVTVWGKAKTQKGHPRNNNGPWSSGYKCLKKKNLSIGGGFKYFIFSPLTLGKIPILTSIFFNWIETSNQLFIVSNKCLDCLKCFSIWDSTSCLG